MSHKLRSAENVCVRYADTVAEVRRLTKIICPGECARMVAYESRPAGHWDSAPVDPCISELFSLKRSDFPDENEYQGASDDIECEMCERCAESLRAVRVRKVARTYLGAAKRAVETVGKRLRKQATDEQL